MKEKLRIVRLTSRFALGIVWLYEGLVPKLSFLRPDEIELMGVGQRRSAFGCSQDSPSASPFSSRPGGY
jgi:hypothetical protein